jgi:predicted type IV restriction endonuclease
VPTGFQILNHTTQVLLLKGVEAGVCSRLLYNVYVGRLEMDFIDQLRSIASRIPAQRDMLNTEEATKNALVMPFIIALGYDVFNPLEVVPELVADVGAKKGEKVDYAIMKDGKPIIIFECKRIGADLHLEQASQLYRYFTVTEARFGVLTDGVMYRLFADLEQPNKMDSKPFFEFNLLDFKDNDIEELKKFTKTQFQLENIVSAATDLKYTKEILKLLAEQLAGPTDDFVCLFASKVYSGRMTQAKREQFTMLTKRALNQFINDRITERLKVAMAEPEQLEATKLDEELPMADVKERNIETTPEEWEAYYIVRAILREIVDVKRIYLRDAQSYCSILFDDNNRKSICRLRFHSNRKQIGLFDESKNETVVQIGDLSDIYKCATQLKKIAAYYLDAKQPATLGEPSQSGIS